jgi:uncharacterized integral membrane protein
MSLIAARHRRADPFEEESAMVILGLVLLIGAGVFAAAVVTSNTGTVGADLWGWHVSNVSMSEVFVAGAVAGAAVLLGLVMMVAGSRRAQRLRRERKTLARENARLVQHLDSGEQRVEPASWPAGQQAVQDPAAVPVQRTEAPAYNEAPAAYAERPGHGSPPPPSYDRARIESERDRPAEDGYEPAAAGQPTADEASRRQR